MSMHIGIDPEIIGGAQLFGGERKCGIEITEQPMDCIHRNLPYPEETENMVNTIGIEIFSHLAESVFPPFKPVASHLLPIVGREAPVLTEHGEVIRRSTGLAIHVEKSRRLPGVCAETADSDWNVTFQHNTLAMSIIPGLSELAVQMILQEINIFETLLMRLRKIIHFLVGIIGIFSPESIVGILIHLAQYAPCGIRTQPIFVFKNEFLVIGTLACGLSLLCEEFAQILLLAVVHLLVVHILESIELCGKRMIIIAPLFALQRPYFPEIEEHRMECKSGIRLVRIRIDPGAGHRCVVHRQKLKDLLARFRTPVHHLLDAGKISDAEIAIRADGEYRDGRSGAFPVILRIRKPDAVDNDLLCSNIGTYSENPVVDVFPALHLLGGFVENHEFIFERYLQRREGKILLPYRKAGIIHKHGISRIPVTESIALAGNGEYFVGLHHRSLYRELHGSRLRRQRLVAERAAKHTVDKRRRIERFVLRQVMP